MEHSFAAGRRPARGGPRRLRRGSTAAAGGGAAELPRSRDINAEPAEPAQTSAAAAPPARGLAYAPAAEPAGVVAGAVGPAPPPPSPGSSARPAPGPPSPAPRGARADSAFRRARSRRERGPAAPEGGRAAAGEPPAGGEDLIRSFAHAFERPDRRETGQVRGSRGPRRRPRPAGARRRRAAAPRGPEDAGPGRAERLPAGAAGRPQALARGAGGRAGLGLQPPAVQTRRPRRPPACARSGTPRGRRTTRPRRCRRTRARGAIGRPTGPRGSSPPGFKSFDARADEERTVACRRTRRGFRRRRRHR